MKTTKSVSKGIAHFAIDIGQDVYDDLNSVFGNAAKDIWSFFYTLAKRN